MAERSSDMTLAFTLAALRELADPAAAVADARSWSEHVGAISPRPNGALTYARERRVELDFFSGTRPPAETLLQLRVTYPTERHVLVGTPDERELAEERGWEFQPVAEAAEHADWEVGATDSSASGSGALSRAIDRLRGAVGR